MQAATYEAPYEILGTSYAVLSADLEYVHWFGRCTPGGCDTCTNDKLLAAGTAWADTFVVGDVCVLTDDDGNTRALFKGLLVVPCLPLPTSQIEKRNCRTRASEFGFTIFSLVLLHFLLRCWVNIAGR